MLNNQQDILEITIVGLGNVGASIALLLLAEGNRAYRINVIDINSELIEGRFLDLKNANTQRLHELIWNDWDLFAKADFVFHTAGGNILLGADRDSVLRESQNIVEDIYSDIEFIAEPYFVVISNPVERICGFLNTTLKNKFTNRIVGTGTELDIVRFEGYLSEALNTHMHDIEVIIIGEHGPGLILLEQHSKVGESTLTHIDHAILEDCMHKTTHTANRIKQVEGHTKYGVAMAGVKLMDHIISNSSEVIVCSSFMNSYYNKSSEKNIYMSLPVSFEEGKVNIHNLELNIAQRELLNELTNKFSE